MSTKDNTKKQDSTDFFESLGNKAIYVAMGLAFLMILYVYWDFITLKKAFLFKDIGSDSINETWPLLYHLSDQFYKNGIIFWSHHFGMGDTFYQYYGDPFTMLIILCGKNNVQFATGYMQMLAILLTVYFGFRYLKLLKLKNFTAIFGSLILGFSGYIVLTSSGWLMAPQFFYFTLGLYAVEAFLNQKKVLPIAITALLLGTHNAIIGIQIFAFLSFYFLIRQIELNELKIALKSTLVKQAIFSVFFLLGFLTAGVFIINYMDLVLTSGRAEMTSATSSLKDESLFALMPGVEFSSLMSRFFSNDLLGSGTNFKGWMNYLESPLTYFGLIPFILSFYGLFIGDKKELKIHRFLFILVFIGFAFPYVRYAFWGFQLNYFRIYSMFLAFFLFFIGIRTFDRILIEQEIKKLFLYIAIPVIAIILFGNTVIPKALINTTVRGMVFGLIIVYGVLLFLLSKNKSIKELQITFLVLLVLELSMFTNKTVNNRTHLSTKELHTKTGYFDYTVDAMDYLRQTDPGYYRIAKLYASGPAIHGSLNDGLIQDFMGLVSYSQFQKKGYLGFQDLAGFFNKADQNELKWSYKLTSDLNFAAFAGAKYVLYKQPFQYDTMFLKPVKTFNNNEYGILRSTLAVPLFYLQNRAIGKTEMMALPPEKRRLMMFYNVTLNDEDLNKLSHAPAKTDSSMYRIDTLLQQVKHLNAPGVNITEFKPDRIKLSTESQGTAIFCSSIPDHYGWKVKVDGQDVPKLIVNGGLIGCELPPGKHTVELNYVPVKLKAGIIVSLVSLGLLLIALFLITRRTKKNKIFSTE